MSAEEADMKMCLHKAGNAGNEQRRATGECWGSGAQEGIPEVVVPEQKVEELSLGVAGISE